jgi:hypothetical protein
MKNIIVLLLFLFIDSGKKSNSFSIAGKIEDNSSQISSINLYKWHNLFYSEFIASIPIVDNEFIYINKSINETDIYTLRHPQMSQSVQFVWDGDIRITITSTLKIHESIIENSPNTIELLKFNNAIQDSLYEPIRVLDGLIVEKAKLCITGCDDLDSLHKRRANAEDFARSSQIPFMLNYVKKHPNSFVSLYLLTKTGMEFGREDYQKHFLLLTDELKSHRRLLPYIK